MAFRSVASTRGFVALVVRFVSLAFGLAACGEDGSPPARPPVSAGISVDRAEAGEGIPALRDAAVVAIDVGGERLCTGALVEEDIVVTARHCVSRADELLTCPAAARQITGDRDPSTLRVYVGSDVTSARFVGAGVEIVAPPAAVLCDADIAFLVLDRAVEGTDPLTLDPQGIARGEFVRALGFGRPSEAKGPIKLEREHLPVVDASSSELVVAARAFEGDSGGPAFDESTGRLVGILSRSTAAPSGEGRSVYTRVDAFVALAERAIVQATTRRILRLDGGSPPKPKAKPKPKPTSAVGAPCTRGDECATLLCISEGDRQYCTRRCAPGDRCPPGFRCRASGEGNESVCMVKP